MLEERVIRATVNFFLKNLWRAVVLAAVFEHVICQSEQQCAGASSSCVQPVPKQQHNGKTLESLWLEVRCHLGCVDQYGGSLSVMNSDTQWPTVDFSAFESDCIRYQKVRECKEGCLQMNRDEGSTVNRCRDNCYTACLEEREACGDDGESCAQGSFCPRACRKTYCRFGCEVYNSIHGSTSNNSIRHPPQSTLPLSAINPSPQTPGEFRNWLYAVDARTPLLSSADNQVQPSLDRMAYSTVAYIIKVTTSNNEDYYYWQKNSMQPLDFSPHACSAISISFSVVSKYSIPGGHLPNFSPTAPLCIPGVGGYPDQLTASSIGVSYEEDFRPEFVGYAIATVSWTRPNNVQFLTSYSIRVYPAEERCGGTTNVVYSFRNIDKELTEFTLRASDNSGLWKFGCTYLIEVVSLPTRQPFNTVTGSYVTSTTELIDSFPSYELNCSRIWDERGHFSISVSWAFPSSTPQVRRFVVTPKLVRRGSIRFFELYNPIYVVNGQQSQTEFSIVTQKFTPLPGAENKRFSVEVKAEKSDQYTWRRIPRTQTCTVHATPLPPRNITEVSVMNLNYDGSNQSLQLAVNVVPSEKSHGTLELYEVVLRGSPTECLECSDSGAERFLSESSPVRIHTTVENNGSQHCLFVNARVFNNYNLSSHWSSVQVVSLDEHCDSSHFRSMERQRRVTVFYESEGSERSKVLEFGCESTQLLTSVNLDTRLQAISERLENLATDHRQSGQSDSETDSLVEMKLRSMEQKLDRILEALVQHQGT